MAHLTPLAFDVPLEAYDRQADELLEAFRARDARAQEAFKWEHPRFRGRPLSEARDATLERDDARLVVARCYSLDGWEMLETYVEAVRDTASPVHRFERAAEAIVRGDEDGLRALLHAHPQLVRARSSRRHRATLLHYVAANGVESMRQRTPPNAVQVAELLIDAGSDVDALADMYDQACTTLSLLVSSSPPAEAGLQTELALLLVERGAALVGPGTAWRSAVLTALTFGFPDTAEALADHAGPAEDLPTAAGLGRLADVERLLPTADGGARHAALALAAQLGRREVVRLLLDAGEDPDRYNPVGLHAHATPLHQAVSGDHPEVVRILVECGARLDIEDTIFEGTPLDWAEYLGRTDVAAYLRSAGGGSLSR